MQAELNKYFYNDITNIILDYHYKTQFYEVIKLLTDDAEFSDEVWRDDEKYTYPRSSNIKYPFPKWILQEYAGDDSDYEDYDENDFMRCEF